MIEFIAQISAWFLGLQMIFFGLNGFFNFAKIPLPPPKLIQFLEAAESARYLLPVTKIIEIIAGALILFPNSRGLGLLLLSPVVFNIMGLHFFLNFKKSWIMIIQVLLPYLLAVSVFTETLLTFIAKSLSL